MFKGLRLLKGVRLFRTLEYTFVTKFLTVDFEGTLYNSVKFLLKNVNSHKIVMDKFWKGE